MKSLRIGITLRVVSSESYSEKRDAISQDWSKILEKIGCIPILIPNTLSKIEEYLTELNLDGFILSGGDNIGDHYERDVTEQHLIHFATSHNIPLLGVCRGMQVINKYFNGTIKTQQNSGHVGNPHDIEIIDEIFYNLFKNETIKVNSFHNNLIYNDMLGKELNIFALSKKDQTVEGFKHKKFPIIGVMWHPERNSDENNLLLLKNLFKPQIF